MSSWLSVVIQLIESGLRTAFSNASVLKANQVALLGFESSAWWWLKNHKTNSMLDLTSSKNLEERLWAFSWALRVDIVVGMGWWWLFGQRLRCSSSQWSHVVALWLLRSSECSTADQQWHSFPQKNNGSIAQTMFISNSEVFTLPHVFHMDSSGLQWTPVDSSGFQCPFCLAKLAGTIPSPVQSSPLDWESSQSLLASAGIHWTPLD